MKGPTKNYVRLIIYPPPRKSLVKGERFIRSEGRPELMLNCWANPEFIHIIFHGICGCVVGWPLLQLTDCWLVVIIIDTSSSYSLLKFCPTSKKLNKKVTCAQQYPGWLTTVV